MQANTRRRIVVIAIMACVILAVGYGFMPKPVPVDVAKTLRGPLRVTIDEEGKTRVRERFVISAPVNGFMRRLELDVGDPVNKGQTVVVLAPMRSSLLDPRSRAEAKAAVSAAQATLDSVKENARAAAADSEYALKKFERNRKLFEQGYIARDLLDQSESDAMRTKAARLSAEAVVKTARFELDRARASVLHSDADEIYEKGQSVLVRTPVAGRVLRIHRESESAVNYGDPLIDIGDPSQLEVKVEVLSVDAVKIRAGMPVLFERWGGDIPLTGKVRGVEPEAFTKISSLGVEEQRVLVIADITSLPESWKRLGNGYRVEASFIIWEGKDVLQVPASALFRRGEEWAVFVVKDRKANLIEVQIGQRNGLIAEILSGVSEGDSVIVHPDDSISDKRRVRLR